MTAAPEATPRPLLWARSRALWVANAAVLALVALALDAHFHGALDHLDQRVDDAVRTQLGPDLYHGWPRSLSEHGAALPVVVVLAAACVFAWRMGERRAVWVLAGAVVAGFAINEALQLIVARVYPESAALAGRAPRSFPSGHVLGATLGWGASFHLASRIRRRRRGGASCGPAPWIATAVSGVLAGAGVIVIRVHWATDVLAAWCLSFALLLVATWWLDKPAAGRGLPRPSFTP